MQKGKLDQNDPFQRILMNKNADLLEHEHFFSLTFNNVMMNLLFASLTYNRIIVLQSHFNDPDPVADEDDFEEFTPGQQDRLNWLEIKYRFIHLPFDVINVLIWLILFHYGTQ